MLANWEQGALLAALMVKGDPVAALLRLGAGELAALHRHHAQLGPGERREVLRQLGAAIGRVCEESLAQLDPSWLEAALQAQPAPVAAAVVELLPSPLRERLAGFCGPCALAHSLRLRLARQVLLPFDLGPAQEPLLRQLLQRASMAVLSAVRSVGASLLRHSLAPESPGGSDSDPSSWQGDPSPALRQAAMSFAAALKDPQQLPLWAGLAVFGRGLERLDRQRLAFRLPRAWGEHLSASAEPFSDGEFARRALRAALEER